MYNPTLTQPEIINCVFSENEATYGGGILNYYSGAVKVTNCTFNANTGSYGHSMYVWYDYSNIDNCIMWGTSGYQFAGTSYCTINYCDIAGQSFGTNIDKDPEFFDTSNLDGDDYLWGTGDDGLTLNSSGSPCVDAGDNDAAEGIDTDIVGYDRIIDGDDVAGAVVDMGAYEFDKIISGDIWVSPSSFNMTLSQGETATRILTITNTGGTALNFNIKAIYND